MTQHALDAIFRHYVAAVLRRANVTAVGDSWQASVFWLEELNATGLSQTAALKTLGERVADRVFDQMRRGGSMAVIDGINLNGGSC